MQLDELTKHLYNAGNQLYKLRDTLNQEEGLEQQKADLQDLCKLFDRWANNLERVRTDQEFEVKKVSLLEIVRDYKTTPLEILTTLERLATDTEDTKVFIEYEQSMKELGYSELQSLRICQIRLERQLTVLNKRLKYHLEKEKNK